MFKLNGVTAKQAAQGDVLLTQITKSKRTAKSKQLKYDPKEKFLTIIKGEHSNHHHGFQDPSAVNVFLIKSEDAIDFYEVEVLKETSFDHFHVKDGKLTGEHQSIQVTKGLYEVRSQREGSFEVGDLTSRGHQQQKLKSKPVID